MACIMHFEKVIREAVLRSRLLASIGPGLLIGSVLPSVVHAQVVVGNGEYYDGGGAPVTISTTDANALAVLGGTVELVTHPVNLTTEGDSTYGLGVVNSGKATLGSAGFESKITTSGNSAYGAYVTSGSLTLNNVTIHTKGGGSAYGLYVSTSGSANVTGGSITTENSTAVRVNGTNTRFTMTGTTVIAKGGTGVDGNSAPNITITGSSITAIGSTAVNLLGSTATISDSILRVEKNANGTAGYGVHINSNGVLHMSNSRVESRGEIGQVIWVTAVNVAESTISGSTIISHEGAHAVMVQGRTWATTDRAPRLSVSGSTILTYGDTSFGVRAIGIETGANAVRVNVKDTEIRTEGKDSVGMAAFQNTVITATNVKIATKGAAALGLYTGQRASLALTGGVVTTTGLGAGAVRAMGGVMSLTDIVADTSGADAVGVRSDNTDGNGTRVTWTGGSILTRGTSAHGVQVSFGGLFSLSGATVETRGANAAGFYFLGTNAQSHNVTVNNSSFTALNGPGVLVRGATNSLTLNNTGIVSEGGTLFDVRRRLVPGSDPGVPDDANPGRLTVVANGGSFKGAVRPDALSTLNFSLSDGHWTVSAAAADGIDPVSDLPLNTSRLNVLTLSDSTVSFAREGGFKVLRADELRGDNSLFEMNTNLGAGAGDFMSFGTAEGDHRLMVRNTGGEPGAEGQHLRLVSVVDPATAATFTLANIGGVVDAGTYRYTLVQEDNTAIGGDANNWALLNTSRLDPPPPPPPVGPGPGPTPPGPAPVDPAPKDLSTTANAAINTGDGGTSQSIWYAEMNALSKRLGELRLGNDEGGLWGRTFARGQKIDNKVGRGFDQTIGGLEIGLDGSIDVDGGRWYLGGVGGYSHSDRDFSFNEGKGNTDSYHVGAYATFIGDNGFYFDGILKLNQMQHDYTIRTTDGMSVDGDYSNAAMGLSFETGWRFKLQDGWFLEPQAELMLYRAEGAEYRTSNGMQVRVGMADSAQLRTSMMVGRLIELSENRVIQPYVKLGWIQEFAGSSTVWTNGIAHKSKLEGGRFDLDVGIMAQLGKNHRLYADYGYASGSRLKEPWSLNMGYRYTW